MNEVLMNADSKRGIFFHQLQLTKFHCLVYEKLCQTLHVIREDIQVHPEPEHFILQKASNKGVVRSWTVGQGKGNLE